MELFKYFTKIISNSSKDRTIHIKALDTIFRAMYGKRVFQPLGIKKVDDDALFEKIRAELYADLPEGNTLYKWFENDWIDTSTGEFLTGYAPSDNVKTLVNNMK
jgi:hypothetical protein